MSTEQDQHNVETTAPATPDRPPVSADPTRPASTEPQPSERPRPAGDPLADAAASTPEAAQTPPPAPAGQPDVHQTRLDDDAEANIEAEVNAAMAELQQATADELPASNQAPGQPSDAPRKKPALRGPRVVQGGREHRTGAVVTVGPTDVFIEFGPKEIGVVERTQFKDKASGEEKNLPAPGDQLEVVVQRYEPSESIFICVLPGAVQKADWEMLTPGQTVEARCTGTNKGGLEMEVAGHRAFMPASQVDIDRIPDLSIFVGEKIECVVQRLDRRGKGNIVLSRREVVAEQRKKAADILKDALQEGQTVEGTVRKIMDFGAFVDLGGIDGLVHISDLSHERINFGAKNVEKHVTVGKKIKVQILKLDWEGGRVSLGLKQLEADPFDAVSTDIVEGAEITGKVTKCLEFGAFVEVAPGVEGLVHISEIDYKRVNAVEDVLQPGEVVRVKVLRVEPETRKVSLSIKALKEAPAGQGGGGGGGRGGKGGRGGRGGRDDRDPSEILKETPQLRRMREEAKRRAKEEAESSSGGLGSVGEFGGGLSLGDLKL